MFLSQYNTKQQSFINTASGKVFKLLQSHCHQRNSMTLSYSIFNLRQWAGVQQWDIVVGWGGGGAFVRACRLFTFIAFRVGACSRLGAYSNKYLTRLGDIFKGFLKTKLYITSSGSGSCLVPFERTAFQFQGGTFQFQGGPSKFQGEPFQFQGLAFQLQRGLF